MHTFTGTTALVTGASKGIGEAFARELAARGARLVLVARSTEALHDLAAELQQAHRSEVIVLAADLRDRSAPATIEQALADRGLEVDLLVNNAGMGAVGPFVGQPLGPNLDSVDLNVTALMSLVHGVGSGMVRRGRGGIINVGSVAGFLPMPFQASYGATKAFVLSFTEALAEELRESGVRVMAVHPGPVATGFFDATTATLHEKAVAPAQIAAGALDDFARGREASFPGGVGDRVSAFLPRMVSRRMAARLGGNFNRRSGHHQAANVEAPVAAR